MNALDKKPLKRVVVLGPECTGKTELAAFLGEYFQTEWVPEYARGYLDNLVRPYNQTDLLTISNGQIRLEDVYSQTANNVLICDTNLYVIKIWSVFKYGTCDKEILNQIQKRPYDLYLLTNIDIPWEDDPQREHPNQREKLYKIYHEVMKSQPVPFVEIKGDREQRRKTAIEAITKLLEENKNVAIP